MTRRTVATLPVQFGVPALIAAICTLGIGCSQLLGITEITAAAGSVDGSITDVTKDEGVSNDTIGSDAFVDDSARGDAGGASDGSPTDDVIDGSSKDSLDGVDAASCVDGLSNVHAGDFLISFTMQTNQTDNFIGLVNQRTVCVGLGMFWDAMLVNQHIRLEVSESMDQSRYASVVSSGAPLNDNQPHDVIITRTNDLVSMVIDGRMAGSKTMDQNLGSLTFLRIGYGVCAGVVTIKGAIRNVCVRPN